MSEQKLEKFAKYFAKGSRLSELYPIEIIDAYTYIINLPNQNRAVDRPCDLSFFFLIHGDEIVGIDLVLELLRLLETQIVSLEGLSIGIGLGNIEAYKKKKRHLGIDLNRSFGTELSDPTLSQRVESLQKLSDNSKVLVDFHQTESYTAWPFYISRYEEISYKLFRQIHPNLKVVTYFEKNFTSQGMTTINYHLSRGGIGFGMELGEQGEDQYQKSLGISTILKLIGFLKKTDWQERLKRKIVNFDNVFSLEDPVSVDLAEDNLIVNSRLHDLKYIKKGDLIYSLNGSERHATKSGYIVFVKKHNLENSSGKFELFRYLKQVGV